MLLILPSLLHMAKGDYNLNLTSNTINVTFTVNSFQNLSSYTRQSVYPANISSALSGSDLAAFASTLQAAVTQKAPGTVSVLSVTVSSNSANLTCTQSCRLQWLNATAVFQVTEPAQPNSGIHRYDLSWKGLRLESDLQTGNVSFNRMGEKYLIPALTPFVNFPNTRTEQIRVTVNNQPVIRATYASLTSLIVLFDVSKLQTPVEGWTSSNDFASRQETWTSPQNAGFNVSAIDAFTEASETVRNTYLAGAGIRAQITTPFATNAHGDMLFSDQSGDFYEQILPILILATAATLVSTLIIERRVSTTSTSWKGKRKRKRS